MSQNHTGTSLIRPIWRIFNGLVVATDMWYGFMTTNEN
jgi:hypothetical protein